MIYKERLFFLQALGEAVKQALLAPESHKDTAVFKVGDPKIGHYLYVNRHGWSHEVEGVNIERHMHIAAPLGNLQSAAVFFGV